MPNQYLRDIADIAAGRPILEEGSAPGVRWDGRKGADQAGCRRDRGTSAMSFIGCTAVIADDHELFRSALAAVLQREFRFRNVVEVGSFDEATDQLGRHDEVAIALVDLRMPGMDGPSSLHRIRDVFPGVRLAVVTASERREDILQALTAGAHGFIPKTFRIAEIAAAVRTILEGGIFVPPTLASKVAPVSSIGGAEVTVNLQRKTDTGDLSPRQSDVLRLMADGQSNKEIARGLGLAEGTVKVHVAALFKTLGARNRVSAVAALKRRLTGY